MPKKTHCSLVMIHSSLFRLINLLSPPFKLAEEIPSLLLTNSVPSLLITLQLPLNTTTNPPSLCCVLYANASYQPPLQSVPLHYNFPILVCVLTIGRPMVNTHTHRPKACGGGGTERHALTDSRLSGVSQIHTHTLSIACPAGHQVGGGSVPVRACARRAGNS